MKVCTDRKKLIVELALGALEPKQALALRTHLESCAGCREYLAEISQMNSRLRVASEGSAAEASDAFHERVMRVIRQRREPSGRAAVAAWLREAQLGWRLAGAGLAGLALAMAAWLAVEGRPGGPTTASAPAPVPQAPALSAELPPSVANYRMAANRSLEELDDLLTQQAKRHVATRVIYTASTLGTNPGLSD